MQDRAQVRAEFAPGGEPGRGVDQWWQKERQEEFRIDCNGGKTWDETEERDPESGATLFGHLHLLARSGIPIIENLDLEALSRDRVREFLFICTPLKFVGATGSPVRPIAVA